MGNSMLVSSLADTELVTLAFKSNIRVYGSFQATERRLVFVHGDSFKSKPNLVTILPTGDVEGPSEGKTLNPIKEKALVTFPFPQFLDKATAQRHPNSNFVWPKDENNESYALAHIWTLNYNDEFRNNFQEADTNPDPTLFSCEAVENFYIAVTRLFGEEARQHKVKYCTKATRNVERTFVGTPSQIKTFLESSGVKKSLGIQKVDGNEIHVDTIDKKGKRGTKTFNLGDDADAEQVLYKRTGYTSFMCIKPLSLFEKDCVLQGQISDFTSPVQPDHPSLLGSDLSPMGPK